MESILTSHAESLKKHAVLETHNPETRLVIGAWIKRTFTFGKLLLLSVVSNIKR